ncbi:MAG: DUF2752 domain-containing protein [Ignavibacteriaceae bacterium]|jgi:hypothetical protein
MNLVLRYNKDELKLFLTLQKFVIRIWKIIGFEALVWVIGLTYLIFINSPETAHFTICPFANLGIEFCPGCGLGNSISYLFVGDFVASFHSHPLGIFALLIIIIRILTIIKNNWRRYA